MRRGFTLLELMVVVGIIVVMTAMAIPAISKFLDGQSLDQSGRIVQSAFNEARRAAITQRSKNYLIFFRTPDDNRDGQFLYGIRRYRERVGYEGEPHYLLPGVKFDINDGTGTSSGGVTTVGTIRGLQLPVFEGLPGDVQPGVFTEGRVPLNTLKRVEFVRDGTIVLDDLTDKLPHILPGGENLFDRNAQINLNESNFDSLADLVDMNLREISGKTDVDKRCFIDLDPNTGRLKFRVVQVTLD